MRIDRVRAAPTPLQGQLLRRSERREVAIFLRDQALWIADFIDGDGELVDATTWFRFNCGDLTNAHARRRMVLESAIPLSPDLVARIRRLAPPEVGRNVGPLGRLADFIVGHLRPRRLVARIAARWRRCRGRQQSPQARSLHAMMPGRANAAADGDRPRGIFL